MQYKTVCLIGIISLLGSIWCGESSPASANTGVFKLEEVIELALNRNPAMAGAAAAVKQSRGERTAAGAYMNPSISGTAGRGAITDPRTGVVILEHQVTIEQPVELPGKRPLTRVWRRPRRESSIHD